MRVLDEESRRRGHETVLVGRRKRFLLLFDHPHHSLSRDGSRNYGGNAVGLCAADWKRQKHLVTDPLAIADDRFADGLQIEAFDDGEKNAFIVPVLMANHTIRMLDQLCQLCEFTVDATDRNQFDRDRLFDTSVIGRGNRRCRCVDVDTDLMCVNAFRRINQHPSQTD